MPIYPRMKNAVLFPVIHICVQCKTPFVQEVTQRVPRFCREKCRKKNYLLVNRQGQQLARAKNGARIRPGGRKGPKKSWGDAEERRKHDEEVQLTIKRQLFAIREKLERESVHRTEIQG